MRCSRPWPSTRGRRRLRRWTRPGGGARHVPGRELDPHEPGLLRADEHGVWRAVPAAGDRRDLGRPRRLAADARSSASSGCSWPASWATSRRCRCSSRASSSSARERCRTRCSCWRRRASGIGFGLTVPGDQHVRRRVLPGGRGPRGPLPERVARPRDSAGAGPGGGLPRARLVVGVAGRRRRPDRGPDRLQPGLPLQSCSSATPRGRRASGRACPRGSGSSPCSRCSTGSSRRRTATGRRCT